MSSSDCNPATISLPYARRCEASHKPSRANDASYLGMELLDTNPVDSERHVRCVSYVIGPEAENQKTISVPSRIVFNLFDQLHGFQQSSNQVDQPTSIKVFVVTYDALHYNYAYTNGQILSLIKEAKRLDTLVVHRIKDHAPHLPIHMYKADFIVSVESAYLLNKGDDLRQEEETRKSCSSSRVRTPQLSQIRPLSSSYRPTISVPQVALQSIQVRLHMNGFRSHRVRETRRSCQSKTILLP